MLDVTTAIQYTVAAEPIVNVVLLCHQQERQIKSASGDGLLCPVYRKMKFDSQNENEGSREVVLLEEEEDK